MNRSVPALKHLPGAIAFLGYDWRQEGASLGNAFGRARTAAGLSISELAVVLGDESTVAGWETELHEPSRRSSAKLAEWLTAPQDFDQPPNGVQVVGGSNPPCPTNQNPNSTPTMS
ncbi:MAG TPA: helix-turn-helix transcriptional regulator [Bryobacteraceae bacterium]|nr:helix-turn-helix transcriptional regulator [Bryobacteraceae bacterium]